MAYNPLQSGDLAGIDVCERGDNKIAGILESYTQMANVTKTSRRWARVMQWVENIMFSSGRQYLDDLMMQRLARSGGGADGATANLSLIRQAAASIPRPVNDMLGRYVESNVALLTENRPVPRCTAKSDDIRDRDAAEIAQLTVDYMWEKLALPEKHREVARTILHCGVCWIEIYYDPAQPRYIKVPATKEAPVQIVPESGGGPPIATKATKQVTAFDKFGRPLFDDVLSFGDVVANVVSPFELHFPTAHNWGDERMNWVMKESIVPISVIMDKFGHPDLQKQLGKRKGWFIERIAQISPMPVYNLPLWWWERLADVVEGSGPSIHLGSPADAANQTIVRVFDRKPCSAWPKGRTVITIGGQVIYDSPIRTGARCYDTRWPDRWHPYVYYAWDKIPGSVWARSLVTRLLPKIKRVNAIDTTLILWRRSVPTAAWITPKSTTFNENMVSGRPGQIIEYDPRRTAQNEPKVVYPPPFPEAALREREIQLQEMDMIAGTEEIMRGQRPVGVSSAQMIAILRRQILASRSGILQAWDESLEKEGSAILQEIVKNIKDDQTYLDAIQILAREKNSKATIKAFSGTDLSDNVVVRIDTASQAFISKEARQAQAIEFIQYANNLVNLPPTLQQSLIEELGYSKSLNPQGPDIDRAKRLINWIKQRQFEFVWPMPEDNAPIILEFLIQAKKADSYWDFDESQALILDKLIQTYQQVIQMAQMQQMQMMQAQMMMQAQAQGKIPPGGEQQGKG